MEIRRQQSSMQLTLRKFALIQSFKTDANSVFSPNQSVLNFCSTAYTVQQCLPDMELGHWVTGSTGHLGHLSRRGHRVIILTRCETRVIPVFEKMPKMQNVHLKCWNAEMTKVVVKCLLLDWNHWMSVHAMNFYFYLWLLKILTHKSTFGVHYRPGSPGQLGLRVAGFPVHWVARSQNVTQFHVWCLRRGHPAYVATVHRPVYESSFWASKDAYEHRTIVSGMNIQQGVMWIGCNPASKPSGKQAAGVYVGQAEFWPGDVQVVWFARHFTNVIISKILC